jgi:hypothetical protein
MISSIFRSNDEADGLNNAIPMAHLSIPLSWTIPRHRSYRSPQLYIKTGLYMKNTGLLVHFRVLSFLTLVFVLGNDCRCLDFLACLSYLTLS